MAALCLPPHLESTLLIPTDAMKQVSASLPPGSSILIVLFQMEFGAPSCNTWWGFFIPLHPKYWYIIVYLHISLLHHTVSYCKAWIFLKFIT